MGEWKFGLFYFNPADPRIFVPKANGLGITLNFGHPVSWIMLAVILLFVVVTAYLRRNRKHG